MNDNATNASGWVANVSDGVASVGNGFANVSDGVANASGRVEQIQAGRTDKAGIGRLSGRVLSDKVHAIAFWFLIVALFGACGGIAVAFKYHSNQLDRTVQIGSFVHKDAVYEVKPRGVR